MVDCCGALKKTPLRRSLWCCGAPGMFDAYRMKVPNGGWQLQPLANDKGVAARQGLEEVGGKTPA